MNKKITSFLALILTFVVLFVVGESGGSSKKSNCVCLYNPNLNNGECRVIVNNPLRIGYECVSTNGFLNCYKTQCTGSTNPDPQQ